MGMGKDVAQWILLLFGFYLCLHILGWGPRTKPILVQASVPSTDMRKDYCCLVESGVRQGSWLSCVWKDPRVRTSSGSVTLHV